MSLGARRSTERWVWATIGLAWGVVAALHTGLPTSAGTGVSPASLAPSSVSWATLAVTWPLWIVMSIAMMVPAALPAVRHVADNSFRWRRRRAVATFLCFYVTVWAAFGLVALAGSTIWDTTGARHVSGRDVPLFAALVIAIIWQLTPWKRKQLRGCQKSVPLAPRGWKAFRACARFGVRYGARCTGSCWAVMMVMAAATAGHLWWSIALTAVIVAERSLVALQRRPQLLAVAGAGVAVMLALNDPAAASGQSSGWFCTLPAM